MSDVEKGHSTQVNDNGPQPSQDQFVNNYDGRHSFAPRPTKIGNPGALGLFSFASTTFLLSLLNVNARSLTEPNIVVGMALFTGGLGQFMAGMWEFPRGNVFGATAFTSYGAFWMSFATILVPGSGITAAYATADELNEALGLYLMIWFVFTVLLTFGALRRNIAFIALLGFLSLTFLLLAIAKFNGSLPIQKAGGAFGILTAWIAYYAAVSELLVPGESWFTLPLGGIKQKRTD